MRIVKVKIVKWQLEILKKIWGWDIAYNVFCVKDEFFRMDAASGLPWFLLHILDCNYVPTKLRFLSLLATLHWFAEGLCMHSGLMGKSAGHANTMVMSDFGLWGIPLTLNISQCGYNRPSSHILGWYCVPPLGGHIDHGYHSKMTLCASKFLGNSTPRSFVDRLKLGSFYVRANEIIIGVTYRHGSTRQMMISRHDREHERHHLDTTLFFNRSEYGGDTKQCDINIPDRHKVRSILSTAATAPLNGWGE